MQRASVGRKRGWVKKGERWWWTKEAGLGGCCEIHLELAGAEDHANGGAPGGDVCCVESKSEEGAVRLAMRAGLNRPWARVGERSQDGSRAHDSDTAGSRCWTVVVRRGGLSSCFVMWELRAVSVKVRSYVGIRRRHYHSNRRLISSGLRQRSGHEVMRPVSNLPPIGRRRKDSMGGQGSEAAH